MTLFDDRRSSLGPARSRMTSAKPVAFPSHPVDRHVGRTVAAHRLRQNLSQKALADALGLSFQQVQKYEKGLNRISASKLWEISRFLGVDLERLFPPTSSVAGSGANDADDEPPASTRHALEIGRIAPTLGPPGQRLILALMRNMAGLDKPNDKRPAGDKA